MSEPVTAEHGGGLGPPAANGRVSGAPVLLRDLTCRFGDVVAVDGITLAISPGEFVSLLGPSGSGKTTTLMTVAGFARPTSGTVSIAARDVRDVPAHQRDVGVVFQSYALFPHMTVRDNVGYPLRVRKVGRAEVDRRTAAVLELVRLPVRQYGGRRPQQLSGGQQQRVALARALVYEPRVLLMDEPMGALDRNLRAELQLELKALHRAVGVTVVYVTHDQDEALTMSDRVAVFRDGRIEQVGSPRELYEQPANAFVARFLGEANLLDARDLGGHAGQVMVRPELIDVTAPEAGRLAGRVTNVAYLGGTTRLVVETSAGRIVVKAPSATCRVTGGELVGLAWEPEAAVPIAAEPERR